MHLKKIIRFLQNKQYRFKVLANRGCFDCFDDITYLKKLFFSSFGYSLDINFPMTFNEKLQWLKLFDRNPIYTIMVDKYAVKKYVSDLIGEQYIIPTLGVWDCFDDVVFDSLPNQFVLKCTHDSGSVLICKDKKAFDTKYARRRITSSLTKNFFYIGREYPYKNVKPRILIEKYMVDDNQKNGLLDYKFFCFWGDPKFVYISQGLDNHSSAQIVFLTIDWEKAPFQRTDYAILDPIPDKPPQYDSLVDIAKRLSQGIPFVRVDLYLVNKQVYFSEFTFSPGGMGIQFSPKEWDRIMGDWLILPTDKK